MELTAKAIYEELKKAFPSRTSLIYHNNMIRFGGFLVIEGRDKIFLQRERPKETEMAISKAAIKSLVTKSGSAVIIMANDSELAISSVWGEDIEIKYTMITEARK